MRMLRNSSRHGGSGATWAPLIFACVGIVVGIDAHTWPACGMRVPLRQDRVGDDFCGFGAGLRSAIAILLHRVADAPQAIDAGLARQIVSGAAALGRPVVAHDADGQDFGLSKIRKLLTQVHQRQLDLGVGVEIAERRNRHGIGDIEMPARRRQFWAGGGEVGHVTQPTGLAEGHDAGMGDQRLPAGDIDDDVGGGA